MASITKNAESDKKAVWSVANFEREDTRQIWRFLSDDYEDPVANLALEEAVLDEVSAGEAPSTLRFWRNHSAVVVIGKFQMPELEINREACKKYSASVVRRFTGGGTVFTDIGSLNYSISVNRENPIVPRTIAEIAPALCKGVVEGLRRLGLNAEFEPQGMYVHVNGKKISGTAGLVKRAVAFVHGTLLVDSDLKMLEEILNVPPYPSVGKLGKIVRSVHRSVTSIEAELGRSTNIAEVEQAIRRGFAEALNIELQEGALLESELLLSKEIAAEKRREIMIYSPVST